MRIISEIRLTEGWSAENPAGGHRKHEHDEKLLSWVLLWWLSASIAQMQTFCWAGSMYAHAGSTLG